MNRHENGDGGGRRVCDGPRRNRPEGGGQRGAGGIIRMRGIAGRRMKRKAFSVKAWWV